MKPLFHQTLNLGMQANREPPRQNQHNDMRTQQKTPSSLTRVFAVGSEDEQTRKVSFCLQQRLWSDWDCTGWSESFAGNTDHYVIFVIKEVKGLNMLFT